MLTDRSGLPPQEREELQRALGEWRTLADVVGWAASLSPPRQVDGVVVQDEFSHDVLVPWRDGRYLVFGTT